ncbi:hypothetical protein EDC01DRAFT_634099 [Geopyxis carbonaria]|nr:hypothetical protein EDC01DRAFT_634099 [Geopyxis carbonaria]
MVAYKDRHSLDTLDYATANTYNYNLKPLSLTRAPCRPREGYSWRRSFRLRRGQPVFYRTLVTRSYTFTVADREREAALGQTAILRVAFKLLDWVNWSVNNSIDTTKLYRIVDQKVWSFVTDPKQKLVDPDEVHLKLRNKYADGVPDSWKNTTEAKATLEAFRQYAAFWYNLVYDHSKGVRLAVHRDALPDDFPDNEFDAFIQVTKVFSRQSGVDFAGSGSRSPAAPGSHISVRELDSASTPVPLLPTPTRVDTVRSIRSQSSRESPVPPTLRVDPKVAMATKFPARIRADRLVGFDGKPQRIFSVDLSVEDMCGEHNYPGYYGGTVTGNAEDGYKYVRHDTPGSASNYQFGSRICSAITSRFVDDAAVWWEDYRQAGGEKPNCWKTSSGCGVAGSRPPDVVEVSLFDILTRDFPAENDVTEAKLELSRLKWDAGSSDVMPFATFRNKATALAKRAGYVGWDQQCPVIRECIEPPSLRKAVQIYDSADTFWFHTRANVNTWLREHVNLPAKKCATCGGSHETANCRRTNPAYPGLTSNAPKTAACDWCGIKGHYKSECLRLKNQISRGEVAAEERNKRGGPLAKTAPPPPPAAPPPQNRFPPRAGLPRPLTSGNARPYVCRNCGGTGHAAAVCPSAKKTAVAATHLVDDGVGDNSGDDDVAQYVMNAWVPYRNNRHSRTQGKPKYMASAVSQYEGIDELFSTVVSNTSVEFPLFNNITTPVDDVNVIEDVVRKASKPQAAVVKVSDAIDMSALGPPDSEVPSGPVWTIASTMRGQDLLTIFDTGAVKAAIPLSTANGSRTPWTTKLPHDLYFVKADGSRYKPAGFCPAFKFRFGSFEFDIEAYVVDKAPFQLLLGTEFLWATGWISRLRRMDLRKRCHRLHC